MLMIMVCHMITVFISTTTYKIILSYFLGGLNMGVYVLSYRDWDYSTHYILNHNQDFSNEDFLQLCLECKDAVYPKLLKEAQEWNDEYIKRHPYDKHRKPTVWDEDLLKEIKNYLVDNYGFKEINVMEFDINNVDVKIVNEL